MNRMRIKILLAIILSFGMLITAFAGDVEVYADRVPQGKTGSSMTVSFKIYNNSREDLENLGIGFSFSGVDIGSETEDDLIYGYAFPFEVADFSAERSEIKSVGDLDAGKSKTVSLTGKVRRDLTEGYYKVPIRVYRKDDDGEWSDWGDGYGEVRIWISTSTSTEDDDDEIDYGFVLGEGQNTPNGIYPNVLDFSLNMRNNSSVTVYDVKVSMEMDADSSVFPFEINEINYDRYYEKMEENETVQIPYSFAIRSDTYSGYYPITIEVDYSDSSTGDGRQQYETSFFVRITNLEEEDSLGDFNENDRTMARLIVDGFQTIPETIIAGEEFDLILNVKNASTNISASNILLSLESEKVSDSAVFTTDSGSSSVALENLGAGKTQQITLRLKSKAGIDQRSYSMTLKAKFDSPEFKNAEETMVVDIPIKQIAKLNTSAFEILPNYIEVGDEANVMFGINNTGKVILYNVMVRLEADTVLPIETYVGHIEPGKTGNVDVMVMGIAPTMDSGNIKAIISYEDEEGTVYSEEKEIQLFVMEPMIEDDMMGDYDIMMPDEMIDDGSNNQQRLIIAGASGAVIVFIIIVLVAKKRKKKREFDEEIDDEDF